MHHDDDRDCHVIPTIKHVDATALATARTVEFTVSGIGCDRCALRVRNALLTVDTVLDVSVDAATGVAIVAVRPGGSAVAGLAEAVAGASDGRHTYRARVRSELPA